MNLRKITVTAIGAALAATVAIGAGIGSAVAQDWPDRPITVVLPMGAGGSHDLTGRVFASVMHELLGQPFVVTPTPGAGGVTGQQTVASATPDCNTLLYSHNFFDQLQLHTTDLPYSTLDDFVTVARVNFAPHQLIITADKPWQTFQDLIDAINEAPGTIKFGHSGVWGATFTPGVQWLQEAGVLDKVELVPFQGGGPQNRALISGEVDFVMAFPANVTSFGDRVRVLASGGEERTYDDVPTFAELGFPEELGTMERVVFAPRDCPADRVEKLRAAFDQLNENRSYQRLMGNMGEDISSYMSGAEYEAIRAGRSDVFKSIVASIQGN